jgi:xanthine/CO dehydrogenase XdhC/CoxF family maturation factor
MLVSADGRYKPVINGGCCECELSCPMLAKAANRVNDGGGGGAGGNEPAGGSVNWTIDWA